MPFHSGIYGRAPLVYIRRKHCARMRNMRLHLFDELSEVLLSSVVYRSKQQKVKGPKRLREPRYAIKTRTEIDVMEDGYKWRKYGQKPVKNSPHPRYCFDLNRFSITLSINLVPRSAILSILRAKYHVWQG